MTDENLKNNSNIRILNKPNESANLPFKLTKHNKSYEERLKNYIEVRNRIFGDENEDCEFSSKIKKARSRFENRKSIRKMVVSSVEAIDSSDPRMFADIYLKDTKVKGLLDSGASVSVLGKDCFSLLKELGVNAQRYRSKVTTAAGRFHKVNGKIKILVKYRGKEHEVTFYLCPSLEQKVYLGIDFWRIFNLAPDLLNVSEIDYEKIAESFRPTDKGNLEQHTLSEKQQKELENVKSAFKTYEKDGLGKTSLETHTIQLIPGAEAFKERHFPVSPKVQELLFNEIDTMLKLGVIEESESPWNSRVTLVCKPGKNRLCLDARKLNNLTVKDAYPIQNIEGILSRIDETIYISSIDLKYAFWQIELEPKSRELTAFTIPGRPHYQYRVMPFGLCNAAQRLCRLMDRVIPQRLRNNVFTYLDDLLIISKDFDSHLVLLKEVADCLAKANLTIGMAKSVFCFKELKYLGFVIGGGKLRTDPGKIEAIENIPIPKTPKQVRSFLGTAGWYRRFIKNFAIISAPLTDTLKKAKQFSMNEKAIEAFNELKKALTTAPVLVHPNFKKPFFVQCDASHYGVGAVLFQKDEEDNDRPIAFFSQKLNSAQQNYTTTEKECLAAVLAVKKFRPYIELMEFTIITDHASLKWLMSFKDLSGRLARWSLLLQTYNFHIEHRKGSENVVPDMLSRAIEEIELLEMETTEFDSPEYKSLIANVEKNKEILPDLKVDNGVLYKKMSFTGDDSGLNWKLWVPENLVSTVIAKYHDTETSSHGGIAKTLHRIRQFYYWPKMVSHVKNYINNCSICKETKATNYEMRPRMGSEVITYRPFQKIYIDFLGKYPRSKNGHAYVFIVLDHFSKFVFIKPMREATAKKVVEFLVQDIFHTFGTPEIIHSDNGKQFLSNEFQQMIKAFKINHMTTAAYAPQSNASERVNRSILAGIRAYLDEDHTKWDAHLSDIESAVRSSFHESIGTSPYFALFGHHMFSSGADYELARKLESLEPEIEILERKDQLQIKRDLIKENIHKAYEKGEKQYNKRSREVSFRPGQEVYVRNFVQSNFSKNFNAKFAPKFKKCRILAKKGNNMYDIETLQGNKIGTFHAKDIKQ